MHIEIRSNEGLIAVNYFKDSSNTVTLLSALWSLHVSKYNSCTPTALHVLKLYTTMTVTIVRTKFSQGQNISLSGLIQHEKCKQS